MRTFIFLFVAVLAAAHPALAQNYAERQAITKKHYRLGQEAFVNGDLVQAKAHFQTVVHHDPKHTYANAYLAKIRVAEKKGKLGQSYDKKLAAIVIPNVELKDATLTDALQYMRERIEKESAGRVKANLILMTSDEVKQAKVSLSLAEAPATEVLRYMALLAGAELRYDSLAVVLRDKGSAEKDESAKKPDAKP